MVSRTPFPPKSYLSLDTLNQMPHRHLHPSSLPYSPYLATGTQRSSTNSKDATPRQLQPEVYLSHLFPPPPSFGSRIGPFPSVLALIGCSGIAQAGDGAWTPLLPITGRSCSSLGPGTPLTQWTRLSSVAEDLRAWRQPFRGGGQKKKKAENRSQDSSAESGLRARAAQRWRHSSAPKVERCRRGVAGACAVTPSGRLLVGCCSNRGSSRPRPPCARLAKEGARRWARSRPARPEPWEDETGKRLRRRTSLPEGGALLGLGGCRPLHFPLRVREQLLVSGRARLNRCGRVARVLPVGSI